MQKPSGNGIHHLFHQYLKFSLISSHPSEFSDYYHSLGKLQGFELSEDASSGAKSSWIKQLNGRKGTLHNSEIEEKWSSLGYGDLDIVDDNTVRIYGSADSLQVPDSGAKVCYYNSGLLSGYVSNLVGESLNFREHRCISEGEDFCEFKVSNEGLPPIEEKEAEKAKRRVLKNISSSIEDLSDRMVDLHIGRFVDTLSGIRGMRSLLSSAGKDFGYMVGKDIKDVNFENYLENFNSLLASLGAGEIEIVKLEPLAVDLDVYNSPFVHESSKGSSCHFLTGAIKGALEEFTNTGWHTHESECASQDKASCEIRCRNI